MESIITVAVGLALTSLATVTTPAVVGTGLVEIRVSDGYYPTPVYVALLSSMSPPRRLFAIVTTADGVNTYGAHGKGANIGANAMSGSGSSGESTANAPAGRAAAIL
jgi:hypothetical protein